MRSLGWSAGRSGTDPNRGERTHCAFFGGARLPPQIDAFIPGTAGCRRIGRPAVCLFDRWMCERSQLDMIRTVPPTQGASIGECKQTGRETSIFDCAPNSLDTKNLALPLAGWRLVRESQNTMFFASFRWHGSWRVEKISGCAISLIIKFGEKIAIST